MILSSYYIWRHLWWCTSFSSFDWMFCLTILIIGIAFLIASIFWGWWFTVRMDRLRFLFPWEWSGLVVIKIDEARVQTWVYYILWRFCVLDLSILILLGSFRFWRINLFLSTLFRSTCAELADGGVNEGWYHLNGASVMCICISNSLDTHCIG